MSRLTEPSQVRSDGARAQQGRRLIEAVNMPSWQDYPVSVEPVCDIYGRRSGCRGEFDETSRDPSGPVGRG